MTVEVQHPCRIAALTPDKPAAMLASSNASLTYGELETRSRQVANLLNGLGCERGSKIALLMENRLEFFEIAWGALRVGLYVVPINWHLSADETAYVVEDCGASVLFASSQLTHLVPDGRAPTARHLFSIDEPRDGFASYAEAIATQPQTVPTGECEGAWMFYSSGTTGRPKGIEPAAIGQPLGSAVPFTAFSRSLYGLGADTTYLSPAPLYHAAPANWTTTIHRLGGTVVVMDQFDAREVLRVIENQQVTAVQFVPTHMTRLLDLPDRTRAEFDLSSLKVVVHAAAPCPPAVKRAMIDWLGPIVYEFYSGSEGVGFCAIDSSEWLAHPGSVGRSLMGAMHILDENGDELAAGVDGEVWFETEKRFAYHGDPAKSATAYNPHGWATLGDIGHVDADGYLYLTDRVSNMVISGGVNIYPREVEDVLIDHHAVEDVAVIGVPHPDLGEAVRAVVQVRSGIEPSPELAQQLVEFCQCRIARFKCPRSTVFLPSLPRLPTGKLAKRLLPADVFRP